MDTISSHSDLIDRIGAPAIASNTGEKQGTVRAWKSRNRIPPEHWPAVIALAADLVLAVDANWLMRTTPPRGSTEPPAALEARRLATGAAVAVANAAPGAAAS